MLYIYKTFAFIFVLFSIVDNLTFFYKKEIDFSQKTRKKIQIYHTEHKISPPTPKERASRSVKIPIEVERITIPAPPKTRGIS